MLSFTALATAAVISIPACRPSAIPTTQPTTQAASKPATRPAATRGLTLPATIEAYEQADLYARVPGYVWEVPVDIGDRVKAGDVLLTIYAPELEDAHRKAQATHAARQAQVRALQAKAHEAELLVAAARADETARKSELQLQQITTQRKTELFQQQAIPQQEYDDAVSRAEVVKAQAEMAAARRSAAEGTQQAAEADVVAAEADVRVARADVSSAATNVQYTRITAPFDGLITRRLVNRGDLAQTSSSPPATPLLTIQRTDVLRVFVDVPETAIAHVRPGVAAEVRPYSFPDRVFHGSVTRSATALDPATRTMRTEIDLPNPDTELLGGMYAQVTFAVEEAGAISSAPATSKVTDETEASDSPSRSP